MHKFKYQEKCALIVSTCDDYETAWYPYFELIKRYWKNHPKNIYLNTETKKYTDDELLIKNVICNKEKCSWSERLYNCLMQVEEEYIFFSLEDFFLLGNVKDEMLEQCLHWMEENASIAVCRLMPSNCEKLRLTTEYPNFRYAGDDVPYRLDTQFALWRKKDLIAFLDFTEDPWHFEENGSKRIIGTDKLFLWCYSDIDEDNEISAYPYHTRPLHGYGIAWGRWLWNSRKWFNENKIKKVDYRKLGYLPHWAVKMRLNYLYRAKKAPAKGFARVVQMVYKLIDKIEKGLAQIRIHGFKKGIEKIKEKGKKQ